MLILSEKDVAGLFTPRDAYEAVEGAFRAQADRRIIMPTRAAVVGPKGLLGSMPGAITSDQGALGAKLVTFFLDNAQRGEHTHQALIALFDPDDGTPIAIMDGRLITEIRTAAASAVATRALAVDAVHTVAILGTGVQAGAHARALALASKPDDVRIWGRNRLRAETLARELKAEGINAHAVDSSDEACRDADVICTVTASRDAVLSSDNVRPGAHINAVGACTPGVREISADLMAGASIFVDSVDGALHEAGDIILAIADGALPDAPRLTLLADVVAGKTVGRTTADEITLFKSLGIAIEDLACAALVYDRARARGAGTIIEM